MSLNILGVLILFEFLSECRHMYPQGCHVALPRASPYFIGQIGVGQHFAHILGKQAQQLLFRGSQLQHFTLQKCTACTIINGQISIAEYRIFGFGCRR